MGAEDEIAFVPGMFADLAPMQDLDGLVLRSDGAQTVSRTGAPDFPFEAFDRTQTVAFFAGRDAYRELGVWLLATLLAGRDWGGLRLSHAGTALTHLYVQIVRDRPRDPFLRMTRSVVEEWLYFPQSVGRHPFADPPLGDNGRLDPEDRPMARLGWSDGYVRYKARPEEADQLLLEVTPEGACALASLLLDFAMPWGEAPEFDLEAPVTGFAGMKPLSLALSFWLPGSLLFPADDLSTLVAMERWT